MRPDCRCWLEIKAANAAENLRLLRERCGGTEAVAMVKGNAYGMGIRQISEAIAASGRAARFGVASLAEAFIVQDLGVPVQIISSILPGEIAEAVHNGFILPIASLEPARLIEAEAARQNRTVQCEIKIDTGMGRLGIRHENAMEIIPQLAAMKHLQISGMFSHFPAAGAGGDPATIAQITRFKELIGECGSSGITFRYHHFAASDAINHYPESCRAPFNLIRPGIALSGFGMNVPDDVKLLPVVEFKARLIAVREMPAGATVGYNRLHRLQQPTRLGVVSAGYSDGIPVALTNRGYFLVNGNFCPIIGRVSMDYTTISLADLPSAAVGDEVVCFGTQNNATVGVEDWAKIKGTIPQDILGSIGTRPERFYL